MVIRGLFSPEEVAEWREPLNGSLITIRNYWINNIRFDMTENEDERGLPIPWKVDPFTDLHPTLGHIVRDRRICDAMCSLYGGYEPCSLKKIQPEATGSKGNRIHQDYNWWQGFRKVSLPQRWL